MRVLQNSKVFVAKGCQEEQSSKGGCIYLQASKDMRLCSFSGLYWADQEVGLCIVAKCQNSKCSDVSLKEDGELCCSLHLMHVLGLVFV